MNPDFKHRRIDNDFISGNLGFKWLDKTAYELELILAA